jgi:protein involved in polysaccharide export with SLBB domain
MKYLTIHQFNEIYFYLRRAFVPATLIMSLLTLSLFDQTSFANEDEYIIGSEDVLQISFFGNDELNTKATVRTDGMIMLPIIGDLKAAGMTPSQLSDEIEKSKLSQYFKDVQVTIQVVEFKSKKIYVWGQVSKPGELFFGRIPSLIEVLNKAGGLTPDADRTQLRVFSMASNIPLKIVNLDLFFQEGDKSLLPQLNSGDAIYVDAIKPEKTITPEETPAPTSTSEPEIEPPLEVEKTPQPIKIVVIGQARQEGIYEFPETPMLAEVITKAGSVTDSYLLKKVMVVRSEPLPGKTFVVDMKAFLENGDASLLPRLQSGDVIYIPETSPVEQMKQQNISILGAVNSPGSHPIDRPVALLDAIAIAGGLTPDADLKRITITRETPEFFQTKEVDIEKLTGKEEQPESSPVLIQPGDVISVPQKRNQAARIVQGSLTFLRDLIFIYSTYRVIVR